MTSKRTANLPAAGCDPGTLGLSAHVRPLKIVLVITGIFMIVEIIGGVVSNSLALLADAAHMLTDVAAVGLAIFVAWIAQKPASPEKTFGYLRLEILAALINGSALFVIAGAIVWEAFGRFQQPPDVEPRILFGVATAGLIANLISMKILHGGHEHSLNVRGAYLHVLSDLLGSVGAIIAGAVILLTGWTIVDPIISVLVAALILVSAWRLVRESVEVLLEATPKHIDMKDVESRLAGVPGVSEVHDLHVWTVTSGLVAMSGHLVVPNPSAAQRVLEESQREMRSLGIDHLTIQIEQDGTCVHELTA